MPDRHSGPLGDEMGVEVRVVPEIAPVRPEILRRSRSPLRRSSAARPGAREDPGRASRPARDRQASLGGSGRRRRRASSPLSRARPRRTGRRRRSRSQGSIRASSLAGIRARWRVAPAAIQRAASAPYRSRTVSAWPSAAAQPARVDHPAPVPEHRIVLNPADHIGHQVVPAERNDAACQLVI